jgi:hypothetical protein
MSLAQHVRLRYRADGHLRFELPAELCEPGPAAALVEGLAAEEGIYRVDLYRRGRKLSIRYLDTVRDFAAVVNRLHALIGRAMPSSGQGQARHLVPQTGSRAVAVAAVPASQRLRLWLAEKLQEARETLTAMSILIRRSLGSANAAVGHQPRWVKEFLNDLLMLYLIKLHWHHIITEWLPRPWTHRYEWAATIYLIHLSVQARLPKPA